MPVYFDIFGFSISAHLLFEMLAYSVGFQIYLRTRRKWKHDPLPFEKNLWIILGAIFGALFGSKLLNGFEYLPDYWAHRDDIMFLIQGKTIVGGLLGGWIGVEIAKKRVGVPYATGDAFVFPLILAMAIGRIGCFLAGLEDGTYGVAASLPWAVDYGDGILRHPTQLYEIAALLAIGGWLLVHMRKPYVNGFLFRSFMFLYLIMRFCIEFIKPSEGYYLGLSAIQVASLIGAIICGRIFLRSSPFNAHAIESVNETTHQRSSNAEYNG